MYNTIIETAWDKCSSLFKHKWLFLNVKKIKHFTGKGGIFYWEICLRRGTSLQIWYLLFVWESQSGLYPQLRDWHCQIRGMSRVKLAPNILSGSCQPMSAHVKISIFKLCSQYQMSKCQNHDCLNLEARAQCFVSKWQHLEISASESYYQNVQYRCLHCTLLEHYISKIFVFDHGTPCLNLNRSK